jgi:hypothetical protein
MAEPHDGRRAQTIRIYLKHHNDPEGKFQPRERVCSDYEDPRRAGVVHKGCGATLQRFVTYPNQRGMLFDSPPHVVAGTEVQMGDGGIVANVTTENVHFGTCPMRQRGAADGKQAAAGA